MTPRPSDPRLPTFPVTGSSPPNFERKLPDLLPFFFVSMAARSSSSSSCANSSPSALSASGGSTHSVGTIHGKTIPIVAALFIQFGGALPVNFWHKKLEKWLQLLVRRL